MKRTMPSILAAALGAVTLGATAAHAEEWRPRDRAAEARQRHDRQDRDDHDGGYGREDRRPQYARRDHDRRGGREHESRHDDRRARGGGYDDGDATVEIGGVLLRW